jgi:hypothetical protein
MILNLHLKIRLTILYPFNMKAGDWITYNNKRKKCFGIHFNGNILIKMNGTLVQVNKEKCKIPA